jgi:hypothetical protein
MRRSIALNEAGAIVWPASLAIRRVSRTGNQEATESRFPHGFHEAVVAFTDRIVAVPLVIALTLPLIAAAPASNQSTVPCQPCVECTDDAGPRVVHLRMYNQTRLDGSVFASILDVTNRIWAAYGVSVEATTSLDAIAVVVSAGTMHGTVDAAPIAIGDTLFTQGHATPYIHLWLGAAELLARNSEEDGRSFTMKPVAERDAILLRMLGVALAHELGHYLLDTSHHSSGGLLQSTMAAREMEQPNLSHLRLSRKELQMMCARPDGAVPQ